MGSSTGDDQQGPDPGSGGDSAAQIQQVLGYLNFSSGKPDPQFLRALNGLFRDSETLSVLSWREVCQRLNDSLTELESESETFAHAQQARRMLQLLPKFCEAYFEYHEDLLAHQSADEYCNSLLIGRAFEVLLASANAATSDDELITNAITQINDYIGYRPVATLESQKIEPYKHEWIRPMPLYVKGAGFAAGKYEAVVAECMSLIESTPANLLRAAYFDPGRLMELAIDPRAYDFDHPANKRPNHHFGHWDPHQIDGDGFYTRFVVQQVTIDSLLGRIDRAQKADGIDADELIFEAAAVLAGTILMSSGISGYGPETHASTVSLGGLLIQIAAYRDDFYRHLIGNVTGSHRARLIAEANRLQQPFAASRQDLNRQLTERRAKQLQRVQLARIFARMRYSDEATAQANRILVPSARISTQIDCSLSSAKLAIDAGQLDDALKSVRAARESLARGIECGAMVDPWNILGFDANFSLFGPIENSLRDYRIDDLVDAIEEMHELFAQLWSKATAAQQSDLAAAVRSEFIESTNWWHQFAAHELDSVDAEDPQAVLLATEKVTAALEAWKQEGEAAGDIGFWAPHVSDFDSCRAYWLVANTLLARDDKVASLGLLMHWLSRSDTIPLEHGETSFFRLSLRWLEAALAETGELPADTSKLCGWTRMRKFFDYLDANAGEILQVPDFEPDAQLRSGHTDKQAPSEAEDFAEPFGDDFADPLEGDEEDRFSAAYENVVYRDSTDDGMEGSVFDFDSHDEDYLQQASRPIAVRLAFIEQLSLIWRLISVAWVSAKASNKPDAHDRDIAESMEGLLSDARNQLTRTIIDLDRLTVDVANYKLGRIGADAEAMANYDRLRLLRDSLLDQIMNATVSVTEGIRFLTAASDVDVEELIEEGTVAEPSNSEDPDSSVDDELDAVKMLRACLRADTKTAEKLWPSVRGSLQGQPILYVPLNRGGSPREITNVRARQHLIQDLLYWLPRLGLLKETYQLLELIREMELTPVGFGAITEFDDLFEVGCRSIVDALVDVNSPDKPSEEASDDDWLVANLEDVMEPLLRSWLAHSRTLRLSVVEQVLGEEAWKPLEKFVQKYGRDLFTQRFLNIGNLRGILHQGVETWLKMIEEREEPDYQNVLDALEHGANRKEFSEQLTFVLEAIVENYSEYRDYNSTTTQSDRGDLLYTLLDFLRLRVSYDRVVWNLRPIVLAHQVLANRGCEETAERWRQSLKERILAESKSHMDRLAELQQKYAMQLPSISKRISERFMRPLMIDYLCALIEPAMFHEDEDARQSAFERIRQQAETFMNEPSGAGLDVPTWLLTMEETIRAVSDKHEASMQRLLETYMLPPVQMTAEQIQSNLRSWETRLLEQSDETEE